MRSVSWIQGSATGPNSAASLSCSGLEMFPAEESVLGRTHSSLPSAKKPSCLSQKMWSSRHRQIPGTCQHAIVSRWELAKLNCSVFRHGCSALVQLTADLCLGKDRFWPYVPGWFRKGTKLQACSSAVKISLCGCNGQNVIRLKILWTATKTYFGFALQQKSKAFFMRVKEEIQPQISAIQWSLSEP